MQIGVIGLGRMGANMTRRIMQAGHECVVYDVCADAVGTLTKEGARGARSIEELVSRLASPRTIWMMLPASGVATTLETLKPLLARDDTVVDGGNSDHRRTIARAAELKGRAVHFVDVGTSGGIWGLHQGYCLMIGGDSEAVGRLQPILDALAFTLEPQSHTAKSWLHCGPPGAGHFVKMIHNGVEYALMAAYAEGLNLLAHASTGREGRASDAETAPLDEQLAYRYDFDVPAIAELWRHGSVVRSWLLDLIAIALREDPRLERYAGWVADSGEGRWALKAAVDLDVPAPGLATALFGRFSSRDEDEFANRLLSAMREQFGGHAERKL
ncbi:MAG TPA: decarboxylating 6-phosphogluconate dehydrogenase [Steroidobacter sp.]|nr:decarboxylating 6-phosphogluconate dehydrogenase [Steroidobacter sp.]